MNDNDTCPLCLETLDITDRAMQYCQCGYQMCLWCWRQLMETSAKDNMPGKCPNCRTVYDEQKITMQPIDPDQLEETKKRGKAEKKGKDKAGNVLKWKKDLQNVRVLQKNLVYAVGLSLDVCFEDVLRDPQYFGQFGKVVKISVNRSGSHAGGAKNGTGSAYITFKRAVDAERCIKAIDGVAWAGRSVRLCFGTTKYCNAFLKGLPCNNSDCLYLHDVAEEDVSFTKEEMLNIGPAKFGTLAHSVAHTQSNGKGKATASAGSLADQVRCPPTLRGAALHSVPEQCLHTRAHTLSLSRARVHVH